MLGPLINLFFFSCLLWWAGVLGIEPLRASYKQDKFSTTELYSQTQNVSILHSAQHHRTPPGKAKQQQSLLLKRNSRCCAKSAGKGLLLSSKPDVSEPLPTTPVSNSHHPGCELPLQQPVRVAGAAVRQWPGFLSRGPRQAGRPGGSG